MADDAAKVDALLKAVRKEEGNKRCFVCQERGPQYVDVEHHVLGPLFALFLCSFIIRYGKLKVAAAGELEVRLIAPFGCDRAAMCFYYGRKWLLGYGRAGAFSQCHFLLQMEFGALALPSSSKRGRKNPDFLTNSVVKKSLLSRCQLVYKKMHSSLHSKK